ncbi:hypothetical protein AC629_34975 [Bradyrhizobium sp. NAS80.1]|nr:hypothetical protein AC629_34975 [Bradyrhizobium sp. NAS80.1]
MRSRFQDDVKISLRAALEEETADSLCSRAGAHFCVKLAPQGSYTTGEGRHNDVIVNVNNVEVGPFNLIPEVSSNLAFEYDIFNLGEPYGQKAAEEFFNNMSELAAGALNAIMNRNPESSGESSGTSGQKRNPSSGTSGQFDKLDTWAHSVHGLAKCDGPVAGDAILFLNKSDLVAPSPTLDSATRGTGKFTSDPKSFEGADSGPGCGENSLYVVVWSVTRLSWQP